MDITSYLIGKKSGGGSTINNQDKTITQDGTYTADSGYTGIGTATVQTNASEYKGTATAWGNGYPTIAYYLDGNWGEPTPHTYTYEELLTLAPQANQTITAGITDVQTAKAKLAQIVGTIAQRGVIPNPVPQLQGDKIQKFVDAIISQVNPATQLESKSVTITENGTTTITPTSGKYGINSVSVTTNVSGGGADEYFFDSVGSGTNQFYLKDIIKKIPPLTINTTNCNYGFSNYRGSSIGTLTFSRKPTITSFMFQNCSELLEIPLFDTSSVTSTIYMFSSCSKITSIPNFDFSNATSVYSMFEACTSLITAPNLSFPKATSVNDLFAGCSNLQTAPTLNAPLATNFNGTFGNCYALRNIPVYDWSNVTTANSFILNCYNLTDTSLDNILQMCISATSYTSTKTLKALGLSSSSYPASRIQALSHYQDFIDAGWTIGY